MPRVVKVISPEQFMTGRAYRCQYRHGVLTFVFIRFRVYNGVIHIIGDCNSVQYAWPWLELTHVREV